MRTDCLEFIDRIARTGTIGRNIEGGKRTYRHELTDEIHLVQRGGLTCFHLFFIFQDGIVLVFYPEEGLLILGIARFTIGMGYTDIASVANAVNSPL